MNMQKNKDMQRNSEKQVKKLNTKQIKLFRIPSIPLTSAFSNEKLFIAGISSDNPFIESKEEKGILYILHSNFHYDILFLDKKITKIVFTSDLFLLSDNSLYILSSKNSDINHLIFTKIEKNVVDIEKDDEGKLYVLKNSELLIYMGKEILVRIPLKLKGSALSIQIGEVILILSTEGIVLIKKENMFSYAFKYPKIIAKPYKFISLNGEMIALVDEYGIKINSHKINLKNITVITPYSSGFLVGNISGEVYYIDNYEKKLITSLNESISSISVGSLKNNVVICITGKKGLVKLISF